ncbi:hypothetical protein [Zooshikella harenae]|uniref:Uncharacterized protein n=1 Tax=Zooshikella harenae TaxID=2827238 RepID=A0ABS5Z992_9GAMM|nr:hypothetical protein [Zooshikella harenae]MBU2710615.1 hypothetical protein [Zooshikella harenae]
MKSEFEFENTPYEIVVKGIPLTPGFQPRYFSNEKDISLFVEHLFAQYPKITEHLQHFPPLKHCLNHEQLAKSLTQLLIRGDLCVARKSALSVVATFRTDEAPDPSLLTGGSEFIAASDLGEANQNRYKLVIEVAGIKHSNVQRIHLFANRQHDLPSSELPPTESTLDSDKYRSLIIFNHIPNHPRRFGLKIPMYKEPPLYLPLADNVLPVQSNTEQDEWDNIVIPIKPLGLMSAVQCRSHSDLLPEGWLYVFWQGKLWRELQSVKGGMLKDVRVHFYRQQYFAKFIKTVNPDQREAKGRWLDTLWIPYRIKGECQTNDSNIVLIFSHRQWSWEKILTYENNPNKLSTEGTSLAELHHYSQVAHFDAMSGAIGPITQALLNQEKTPLEIKQGLNEKLIPRFGKHRLILDKFRDNKIPVVYLNVVEQRLVLHLQTTGLTNTYFSDRYLLRSKDPQWQHTTTPAFTRCPKVHHHPEWIELIFDDLPMKGLFDLILIPEDAQQVPAYIFRNKRLQDLLVLNLQQTTSLLADTHNDG